MKLEEFDVDHSHEVINTPDNYKRIASFLFNVEKPVLIGWTDGMSTHYDILFTYSKYGVVTTHGHTLQRGISIRDLFVSVMGRGSHGFYIVEGGDGKLSPDYVAENLNLPISKTSAKLAELINGVILELQSSSIAILD